MLNIKQKKAVQAKDRFIFLLAGAGTGKTTVIINKIKHLFDSNIRPENVLVLSFTRKSVLDLKNKFTKDNIPFITTFHGFCYQNLKDLIEINIVKENILISHGFSKDELTLIDYYKRNNKTSKLVRTYNKFLFKNKLIDYTDLEHILLNKFKNNLTFSNKLKNKYKYVFVDEFQDTSITQFELLKNFKEHSKIFAVGDPNQSIYSFRGASKRVIDKYIKIFKAKVYLLNKNYRSKSNIIAAANNLIKNNRSNFNFNLQAHDENNGIITHISFNNINEQSEFILLKIRELLKKGYFEENIAVIYRNHHFANNFKKELFKTYFERLNLLTIHQAKGLEFDCVFIIGLEENNLPFYNANIEEERRLFYVAITRAKKKLYLLSITKNSKKSRFIKECLIK